MKLLYDERDMVHATRLKDQRLDWLVDLGAEAISRVPLDAEGFLFSYEHGGQHYRKLVADRPNIHDQPEIREELVCLDSVLLRLNERGITLPTPRTWIIGVDDDLPADLEFPLFVRTPKSSWKRGGTQSKVNSPRDLIDEMDLLRRVFGWDTPILARQWIDVAVSGNFMFGDTPQEIRVWLVNQLPIAWSFHYLHAVPSPTGFPPSDSDLTLLKELSTRIGSAFCSRLIVADFVRDRQGNWWFLEAGPGAAAGTAHEAVFRFVAERLSGRNVCLAGNSVGGPL
ncbi:MAG: hypothetical protein JSS49_04965 [Planctomycetes bacterium]|nr:hypothetical protein [Planctomycetota bacterium]